MSWQDSSGWYDPSLNGTGQQQQQQQQGFQPNQAMQQNQSQAAEPQPTQMDFYEAWAQELDDDSLADDHWKATMKAALAAQVPKAAMPPPPTLPTSHTERPAEPAHPPMTSQTAQHGTGPWWQQTHHHG